MSRPSFHGGAINRAAIVAFPRQFSHPDPPAANGLMFFVAQKQIAARRWREPLENLLFCTGWFETISTVS